MKKRQKKKMAQKEEKARAVAVNYRMTTRKLAPDKSGPATLNAETRSVDVVVATEAAVAVYDYQKGRVINEILLADGCNFPASGQVILLDTHQRWDTATVIGSCRDLAIVDGQVVGRAMFSTVPEAEGPWTKTREGHLTDYSAGYKVDHATWLDAGESAKIAGREFIGPVSVVDKWSLRELSVCPIGADSDAKARAADHIEDVNLNPVMEETMNKNLRAILVGRGLDPNATDAQAWAFFDEQESRSEILNKAMSPDPLPAKDPAQASEKTDSERAEPQVPSIDDAIAAERVRASEIRALGQRFGCESDVDKLITDGASVDEARASVLDVVEKRGQESPDPGAGFAPARVIADARDKFRAAAGDALAVRSGLEVEKPAAGHDELTGYSLVEIARESLRMANLSASGNVMEMTGRALTTSDFPMLLSNVANKSLAAGYATAEETWPQVFNKGSVSDFKTNTRVRASETDDLDEIKEMSEYKYGNRTEGKEEYSIATYGKLYGISRQAIINDDLGALSDIPRAHGEAAARKVGDVAYAVLTANAAMGDGVALFHASHGNLGTGAVVSVGSVAEAIKKMKLQKDLKGKRRLNIRPQFFLAPVTLEGSCEQFFTTIIDAGKSVTGVNNPYSGNYFTRIYEPRLDDDSAAAWYLLGAKAKTITVFFLNNQQTPYMETRKGWDVDGVEYKVRIDAGAKALDWKALVKNAGA